MSHEGDKCFAVMRGGGGQPGEGPADPSVSKVNREKGGREAGCLVSGLRCQWLSGRQATTEA